MELIRIGDKVISRAKIMGEIDKLLALRAQGCSQSDVAESRNLDRSFISRLESIGELTRGRNIGVIGFPVKNKEQVIETLNTRGIYNCLIMSEAERISFVEDKTGVELVNEFMTLLAEYRNYDTVIVIASDRRGRLIQTLLDRQVIFIEIGSSPLKDDVVLEIDRLTEILDALLAQR